MTRYSITAVAILLAASSVSYAQTAPTLPGYPDVKVVPVDNTPAANGSPSNGSGIRQQLSTDLQKAGFSNVTIIPEAFLVRATNKAGDQVTMFISPDSLTVFTADDAKGTPTTSAPSSAPKP